MKRTIILTGASDGIGAAAAKRLATDDNTLILVGRNPEKTRAVADPLGCTYLTADFGDLSQVRDLAARIKEKVPRIDVLINNAGGIFGAVREETVDGYEKTFQVNHLSPFLLTNLLLNELAEGEGVVVNTASLGAKLFSELDMDDLNLQHDYSSTRFHWLKHRHKHHGACSAVLQQSTTQALPAFHQLRSRPHGVPGQRTIGC